jgi:hypothetical protein
MTITHEMYTYSLWEDRGEIVWDVTLAKAIVAQGGLDLDEVDREQQQHIAVRYDITEAKVQAADITQPGIAAPFIWQGSPELAPPGPDHDRAAPVGPVVPARRSGLPPAGRRLAHGFSLLVFYQF